MPEECVVTVFPITKGNSHKYFEWILQRILFSRELLELSETLQQQLVQSREELMHFKRELENRQYLYENNQKNLRRMTEKTFDKSFDNLSMKWKFDIDDASVDVEEW